MKTLWDKFNQRLLERSFNILIPLGAILLAFFVSGLLILVRGGNPLEAYAALFTGAFGSPNAIATTMTRLTPLLFTGLAVAFGYRSGFFNIGAEGQLYLGAIAVTWIGTTLTNWPWYLLLPACILSAMLVGALWASIPGILKARRGFNEVLTTLLMNYLALQFFEWVIRVDHVNPAVDQKWTFVNWIGLKDVTQPFPKSAFIAQAAQLPTLSGVVQSPMFSFLQGSDFYNYIVNTPAYQRFSLSFLIAVAAAVIIYLLLFKTTQGYRCRAVGVNPIAARFMGINIGRTTVTTALISGALAGLAGAMEVMGSQYRVIPGFLVNAGFDGIPVALIGQLHPLGAILSALFFGALRAGANKMQVVAGIPTAMILVIQALAILFAVAGTTIDVRSLLRRKSITKSDAPTAEEVPNA